MRSNKKGFTIVELVIVIAVIAILAAVLIPTIAGLVKKANVTKDVQLVKNLNTAIMSDKDNDKTMAGALASAAKFGYDVAKINASAVDNEILWDSVNNVFCYLNEGEIEYIPDSASKTASGADFWIIDNAVSTTYSTYLIDVADTTVTATLNIDVTACQNVSVKYTGTGAAKVYMNGGNLNVNSGSVEQYGFAKFVDVADSADFDSMGSFVADLNDLPVLDETAKSEYFEVKTADELKAALAAKKAKIILGADIAVEDEITASNANVFDVIADTEINLNGHNITAVRNAAHNVSVNNVVINAKNCNLVLSGYGTVSLKNTGNNMGWSKLSAVARVDGSGSITVNDAVILEHLGGTDMAFAIDAYASTAAKITINGGALISTYTGIRFFYPCADATKSNVTINGGVISGANRDIWIQMDSGDASKYITFAETYDYTTDSTGYKYYID